MSESGWGWGGESEPEIYDPYEPTRRNAINNREEFEQNRQSSTTGSRSLNDFDFGDGDLSTLRNASEYDLEFLDEIYLGDFEDLDSVEIRMVIHILHSNLNEQEKYRQIVDILLNREIDFGDLDIVDFELKRYQEYTAETLYYSHDMGDLESLGMHNIQRAVDILESDDISRQEKYRRINAMLMDKEEYFAEYFNEEIANSEQSSTRVIRQDTEQITSSSTNQTVTRVIRKSSDINEQTSEENNSDIGNIRNKVMQQLYDEFYDDVLSSVRQKLEREKPEIIQEATAEIKKEIKRSLTEQKPQIVREAAETIKSQLVNDILGKGDR